MDEETTAFPNDGIVATNAENTTAHATIDYYPWNGITLPPPSPMVNVSCNASLSDEDKLAIQSMIREVIKEELASLTKNLVSDVISELGKRLQWSGVTTRLATW